MNPYKTVGSVIQKGVSLLALTGFLGTYSLAAPIRLPDWIKPIKSALPRLSPEVISEVDEIRTFIGHNAERYSPEVITKIDSGLRRLVELQEQGDQAEIWQYLKATNSPYPDQTLIRLGWNRDLAAWLLHIVRFRVAWLKQAIYDPELEKNIKDIFRNGEIDDIEYYFYQQGEFSDIENLNLLVDEAVKLKLKSRSTPGFQSSDQNKLQAQVKTMQEARNRPEQQTEYGWKLTARSLIEKGVLTAAALKPRPLAQNPGDGSYRPKPLGPRQPLPEIQIKPLPGFLQPWMMWPMWLSILVVSAGLLRWVFRTPKVFRRGEESKLGISAK